MKAITKAKRRVTLSICGLGMLDESEVRSVLDAEAPAGPVDSEPRQRSVAKPATEPAGLGALPEPTPTFAVKVPYGGEPAVYPRNRGGAKEAFREIVALFNEGHHDIVGLNNGILDEIAARVPTLAEEVSELRAAAAEKMAAAADETEPEDEPDTFVQDFVNHVDGVNQSAKQSLVGEEDPEDSFPGTIPLK